jgi:hypothetical protein
VHALQGLAKSISGISVELVTRKVEFGGEQLRRVIDDGAETLRSAGIQSFEAYIDIAKNEVRVSVSEADFVTAQALLRTVKGMVVEAEYVEGDLDWNKNDEIIYALVEGGQMIGPSVSSNLATSGFAVQSYYGPFILTAGHAMGSPACSSMTLWYQAGRSLGNAAFCQFGGALDVAGISTFGYRNTFGRVHYTYANPQQIVSFAVNASHNLIGQTVCQTGFVTTGVNGNFNLSGRCGVVSSLANNPAYSGGSPAFTASFGRTNYLRADGDSGAAVIWPTIYGAGAAGLHSGGSGPIAYFTQYRNVASTFGLSLTPP